MKNLISERLNQVNKCIALAERHQPFHTGSDTTGACYRTLFAGMKALGGGSTIGVLVPASDTEIKQYFKALIEFHKMSTSPSFEADTMAAVERRMADFQDSGLSFPDFMVRLKEELAENAKQIRNQAGGAMSLIQDACKGRVFFIMEQTVPAEQGDTTVTRKFMGLAPQVAETGDVLCVIYGCPTPMVIRPVEHSSIDEGEAGDHRTHYRLLGECFVHGFMQGEAMEISDAEDQYIILV
ncbi:hypothetical protein P7C71_g4485, partial [Lecanoromycetidae sp. Uapishka_2]